MSLTKDNEFDKTRADDKEAGHSEKPERKVTVIVDDDPVRAPKNTTPREVLVLAGLEPTQRQLVKIQGKHQTQYPDPDVELKVHEGEQFITVSTGGTPVS
jgi:hypothetical protein